MKKVILITTAVLMLGLSSHAQYLPTTGQPFQFAPVYNPAFTGIDPFGDIRLAYRSQVGAFGANSPSFFNALYQFRLNKPREPNVNSLRSSYNLPKLENRPRGVIHGMGINAFDEELGVMSRRGVGVNYAYHYPISRTLMLAVGTSAIVENLRVDPDKIYLGADAAPDPVYQQILNGKSNSTQVNVRAGVVLYSRSFYFGLAYLPLYRYDLKDATWLTAPSIYKATLQTGVAFHLSETVDLKPSIIGYLSDGGRVNFDYNLKVFVRNIFWSGVMWRDTQTGVAQLGFNISKNFSAAYSYEVSTGEWKFGAGSHELVIGIRLKNFKNQPSYIW
jgi:type IX secretion system PorP/SprF family membrane protein